MNTQEYQVRPVDAAEATKLTQLAHLAKAYWGYSPEFMQAFDDELTIESEDIDNTKYLFRVVTLDDAIHGFYTLDLQTEEAGTIEMTALFVEPTMLGKGLGKLLFEHSVQTARDTGATHMIIHSDPYAEKFYTKMGAINKGNIPSRSIEGREIPLLDYAL